MLGNLFKNRSTTKQRRNLMVFLKPSIARDSITENAISSEKYNYIRSEQIRARDTSDGLLNSEQMPMLPEYEDFMQEGRAGGQGAGRRAGERVAPVVRVRFRFALRT
ncbi:MAG: hypothetical protein IPO66_14890 [Rhodanobacteraceae bacterium]|nr:hypothetical protein [Rhodanobacteraceae bacterium]